MSESASAQETDVRRWVSELRDGIAVEDNSRRIFERYYGWVRGFLGRRGFSPQESEDLAQETFLQVFHRISSYRQESEFESWLFAVAANTARNHLRSQGTRKRAGHEVSLEANTPEEKALDIVDDRESPDRAVLAKERELERRRALGRAVDNMPPQMRRCFVQRFEKGLKYREIAVTLKMNIDTVKAHLFAARKRLREELGEDFGDPD